MNFADIFSKIRRQQPSTKEAPNHWVKCQSCHALMYYKEIESCFNVCPKCSYHMRISPMDRIKLLSDENTFVEYDANLEAIDPLKFVDSKSYKKRLSEGE
ncbi:acetyl-CoA carboxylase, carboxyltransferase subunit beta, partial [Campylobacter coli]